MQKPTNDNAPIFNINKHSPYEVKYDYFKCVFECFNIGFAAAHTDRCLASLRLEIETSL